jgi:sulfoxide reductase heme-binding subunit YedZ
MNDAMWAFGRVSGIVALVLFTASVVLGIITRSGRPLPGLPRFSISLLHRNIALLASTFIVLHVGSLMLDSFARLKVVDIVVPFLGSFKPFWQGLGTVAVDLLIAIVVTSLFRKQFGARVFRVIHWSTYAMWPIALAHSIGNGTNGTSRWFLLLSAASIAVVLGAVIWRTSTRFTESAAARQGGIR